MILKRLAAVGADGGQEVLSTPCGLMDCWTGLNLFIVKVCQLRELVVARRGSSLPVVVVGNKADLGPQIHKEIFQVGTQPSTGEYVFFLHLLHNKIF